MSDKTGVKVSEQEVLARQAVMFVLTYIKAYKNIFGNYKGYRSSSVRGCFYRINRLLPIPLKDLEYLGTAQVFPRDKYTVCEEGHDSLRHGHYEPPFRIFPTSERSAVQSFVDRFDIDTSGTAKEIASFEKPIRQWLIGEEMVRAEKAIVLLKARTSLSSFGKKYPELKRALEKL